MMMPIYWDESFAYPRLLNQSPQVRETHGQARFTMVRVAAMRLLMFMQPIGTTGCARGYSRPALRA
jgi:hypothetical protein